MHASSLVPGLSELSPPSASLEFYWKPGNPPNMPCVPHDRVLVRDPKWWQPTEDLLKNNLDFQSSEVRSHTTMDPRTER